MLEPHTYRCAWNAEEQQKEEHPPNTFSERKQNEPQALPFVVTFNGSLLYSSGDGTFITSIRKSIYFKLQIQ